MRFTIEIYSINADDSESVLLRTFTDTISPTGARKEAQRLLNTWKTRKASGARIINAQGQPVYSLAGNN